ncbi:hypothetical protein [Burkholderia thailandensis]|uniref:hypothetical protein n=1 Tax=Burkholderia thailandensis TaxID=57975 RepID=UPI0012B60835|nr:hypothetical protein [Burkholderia thailandensis]MBS2130951.1 hypothetical protein [Burkholderia thailandensis]MCS6470583.1 hypothetical protein [Burkholderia thailandensis]MCS6477683.1 hypothetical protein [Burkholderia thailandensis]MCS6499784.1 hypothetical protein [Burkholderia thailandensis]MCS6507862.1 hypothetical protein [Burkholderia thailandensis]
MVEPDGTAAPLPLTAVKRTALAKATIAAGHMRAAAAALPFASRSRPPDENPAAHFLRRPDRMQQNSLSSFVKSGIEKTSIDELTIRVKLPRLTTSTL